MTKKASERLAFLDWVAHALPRGGGTLARMLWPVLGLSGAYPKRTHHGFIMELDFAQENQLSFWLGFYERPTANVLVEALSPGSLFLDVGANLGYFSLLGAQLVGPQGKVLAFEAEPQIAASLARNAEANPDLKIDVRQVAIGDHVGRVRFVSAPLTGRSSLENEAGSVATTDPEHFLVTTRTIEIEMTTLDEHCLELVNSWRGNVVLKMDIEGAEPLALAGARRVLNRLNAAVVELEPQLLKVHGFNPSDVIHPFMESGFHAFAIPDHRGKPKPIDAYYAARGNLLFKKG